MYTLSVQAFDSGSPAMSTRVTVNIDISDVNDNPPVFAPPNSTAVIQVHACLCLHTQSVCFSASSFFLSTSSLIRLLVPNCWNCQSVIKTPPETALPLCFALRREMKEVILLWIKLVLWRPTVCLALKPQENLPWKSRWRMPFIYMVIYLCIYFYQSRCTWYWVNTIHTCVQWRKSKERFLVI